MRTIAGVALSALLITALSMPSQAQSPPEKGKDDAAKVHSYKKADNKTNSERPPKAIEHLPSTVPHGSRSWWEIHGRSGGGTEGG
jgi:hypothetical protein